MIRPSTGSEGTGKPVGPSDSGKPDKSSPPGEGRDAGIIRGTDMASGTGYGTGTVSSGFTSLDFLDTLFRLFRLGNMAEKGEILKRLAALPATERAPALAAQMKLAAAGIELARDEWEELWSLLSRRESAPPQTEEEARVLLDKNSPAESLMPDVRSNQYFRLLRDGEKRGHIVLVLDEEGSDNLLIRMDTARRRWEFHMVRSSQREREGTLYVYTDDRKLIDNPPPSWKKFRKTMGMYGLKVESRMKSLRKEWTNSDMSNREPAHMVDIIL